MRLIDADAFIAKCGHWYTEEGDAETGYIGELKYLIEKQPTIQSEPHWIPVTKDTPKEADTYMCTCSDAGRLIVTLVKWQPRTKTWNLTGARAYWKVIAWCELPEPFKGVTE